MKFLWQVIIIFTYLLKLQHEKASVDMFDHLIEANQLKNVFAMYEFSQQDITFIKEQIAGPLEENKVK